jgi:hypothetical protein
MVGGASASRSPARRQLQERAHPRGAAVGSTTLARAGAAHRLPAEDVHAWLSVDPRDDAKPHRRVR